MYQITVQVKPYTTHQPRLTPGILTKRFHAFLLSSIQRQSPELSSRLHERKQRQMFSFCIDEPIIVVRSPKKEVVQSLRKSWQEGTDIDLHQWRATVQQIQARYISLEEIQNGFHPNLTLRFCTPTTFYQEGNYYPLPEITRLLVSANKICPMMDQPMVCLEQVQHIARTIRIEKVLIESRRVYFGNISIIGFIGSLDLNLKALNPNEQNIAWSLLSFGSLLGFGYKTAWGLGQATLNQSISTDKKRS